MLWHCVHACVKHTPRCYLSAIGGKVRRPECATLLWCPPPPHSLLRARSPPPYPRPARTLTRAQDVVGLYKAAGRLQGLVPVLDGLAPPPASLLGDVTASLRHACNGLGKLRELVEETLDLGAAVRFCAHA